MLRSFVRRPRLLTEGEIGALKVGHTVRMWLGPTVVSGSVLQIAENGAIEVSFPDPVGRFWFFKDGRMREAPHNRLCAREAKESDA